MTLTEDGISHERLVPCPPLTAPFDAADWIYEIMHDGFRALAVIEGGSCRFFFGKYRLSGFPDLQTALVGEVDADEAILDGELAMVDWTGRRLNLRYLAFDLAWLNGKDLRAEPLLSRKHALKRLLPTHSEHILYVDHVRDTGRRLYDVACRLDLQGIVAKRADSLMTKESPLIKIKNPSYSQEGQRENLFKRFYA
jgi:bifunctional non-homologous end joining protein LigD